jgi:peptidoglycan/xylan/chitin deacetylase (PgdA/CDA1 family)
VGAALTGIVLLALAGGAALSGFGPAMGHTPAQSTGGLGLGAVASGSTGSGSATGAPVDASARPTSTTPPSSGVDGAVVLEPAAHGPQLLQSPCLGPAWAPQVRVVSRMNVAEKVVALTFDDGTDPDNTRRILAILEREHVNATFFPTARSMERYPDLWRRIAAAHFPIANHTYHHAGLAGQCFDAQRRELARATLVFETLGIPELPVIRPPYELFDATTRAAAAAEGLQAVVLWGVDTRDWAGVSAASVRRTALSGRPGSIVLMHTGPEATAKALPGIIKGYRDRGFRFVTIGELLGIDGAVPYPVATPPASPQPKVPSP